MQLGGASQHSDVANTELRGCERQQEQQPPGVFSSLDVEAEPRKPVGAYGAGDVANAECIRRQGQGTLGKSQYSAARFDGQTGQSFDDSAGVEWLECPDGKTRPVEPSIRLLAHGVQHRASLLHAYGNAIVPQVAAEFIQATEGVPK
jgi:DNA (cytosine-5)-methyltransferase 1